MTKEPEKNTSPEKRGLSEQQKNDYISSKGVRCPVCRSPDVSADQFPADITEDGIFVNCECAECNEQWIDHYALSDVELAEENTQFSHAKDFYLEDEFEAEEEIGHAGDDWKDDHLAP